MFFPSAVETFDKQQNQNEICFVSVLQKQALELKKEYCNC
jgi:hypothetical protein